MGNNMSIGFSLSFSNLVLSMQKIIVAFQFHFFYLILFILISIVLFTLIVFNWILFLISFLVV